MRAIPSLDGLRAISICFVIVAHLGLLGARSDALGNLGVRIFFVISGFLITSILLQEFNVSRSIDLRRFYVRRTLRIFPAFYLFLIVLALLDSFSLIHLKPFDLARAGFYVTNYFPWFTQSSYVRHTWSLSNEEQFYLVWPVCLALAGPRKAALIALAVILVEPFVRIGIMTVNGSAALTLDRRFDCLADTLATGCLFARVRERLSENQRYLRFLTSPLFAAVPLSVAAAALTSARPHVFFFVSDTVMNIGIAICIDRSIRHSADFGGKILNCAVFRSIGVMSYSLYLWQQIFLSEGPEWWHAFPVNLGLSYAAASASFYMVERPFQRLKNRIGIAA